VAIRKRLAAVRVDDLRVDDALTGEVQAAAVFALIAP